MSSDMRSIFDLKTNSQR